VTAAFSRIETQIVTFQLLIGMLGQQAGQFTSQATKIQRHIKLDKDVYYTHGCHKK